MTTASDAQARLWHGTAQHSRDQARRRRLLNAALDLYGTVGYRSATVQAVCQLAKVSTRSFYELFSDQEELLEQLYSDLNAEVLDGFRDVSITVGADVRSATRELVAAALRPMLEDGRKAQILEVEAVGVSDSLELRRRVTFRGFAAAVDAAFDAFAEGGLIGTAPSGLTSLVLVGGITEALVQRVQTDPSERMPTEDFIDAITTVTLRLMGASA